MLFYRALLILLVGLPIILSSQTCGAKDYPVGTVFKNITEFDFSGAKLKVPLPPGKWKLLSIAVRRTETSNIELRTHYLIRHTKNLVTGSMRIRVPSELVQSHWGVSKLCSEKRKSKAWYVHEDSYEKHENCSIIRPLRGFKRNSKNLQKFFKYIDKNGLTIPNVWVSAAFIRSDREDFLRVDYALPQEHYGFPRERKFSNTRSPWNINNISSFPKKKAFMEKVRAWAKSWKGLVDKGFKNELSLGEVLAHQKIDGNFNKIPKQAPRTTKHLVTGGTDAESRLKKIKSLLEKRLITPEEYRIQRRKILDQL